MINLILKNGMITFRGVEYKFNGYQIIDDASIHLHLDLTDVMFLGGETSINGVECKNSEEIKNEILKQL